jgi:uncharacterized phiE125 gp8 family phage protein
MQRILITPPEDDVISLDEMKQHLRVEDTEQDALIGSLITAALSTLDPAAEGGLGRALRPQTWELQLDGFWHHSWHGQGDFHPTRAGVSNNRIIALPFPPLISITSVKYDDTTGTEQELTAGTGYQVIGQGGRSKQGIAPPYLGFWPLARSNPGSVRIRYESGYPVPAQDETDTLPGGIKAYIKLMVADLFANREGSDLPVRVAIENPNLSRLLDPHRVY